MTSKTPFDRFSTCRLYKGTLNNNGIKTGIACKVFLVRMTPKFGERIEKEATCIPQLDHPNILRHFSIDFERSIIVSEYLIKKVCTQRMTTHRLSGGRIALAGFA